MGILTELAAELMAVTLPNGEIEHVDPRETMNPIDDRGNVVDFIPAAAPVAERNMQTLTTEFAFGGKAVFTVSNPKGERYTFRIERPENFRGEYFAHVMNGSCNETDYVYIGMLNRAGALRSTGGSKVAIADTRAKVLVWALDVVMGRKRLAAGYAIERSNNCCVCGRLLTTPESIARGFGPDCAEKIGAAA